MTIQQEIYKLTDDLFARQEDKKLQVVVYLGDLEWREFLMSMEPWQYQAFREDRAKFGLPVQFEQAAIFRVAVKSHRHITTISKP